MTTCRYCLGEIEFRYVGGVRTPIHKNGSRCSLGNGHERSYASHSFRTIESYTTPDANCPVCGSVVFFYQSTTGGRVFFDALGWPWPKHPCTDNPASQKGKVSAPERKRGWPLSLRDSANVSLDLYDLDQTSRVDDGWIIKLKKLRDNGAFRASLSDSELGTGGLTIEDWWQAPAFVVAPTIQGHPTRRVYFISERLGQVITMDLRKVI